MRPPETSENTHKIHLDSFNSNPTGGIGYPLRIAQNKNCFWRYIYLSNIVKYRQRVGSGEGPCPKLRLPVGPFKSSWVANCRHWTSPGFIDLFLLPVTRHPRLSAIGPKLPSRFGGIMKQLSIASPMVGPLRSDASKYLTFAVGPCKLPADTFTVGSVIRTKLALM